MELADPTIGLFIAAFWQATRWALALGDAIARLIERV